MSSLSSLRKIPSKASFGLFFSVPPFNNAVPQSATLFRAAKSSPRGGRQPLQERWRRLSTGLRGGRLYSVTPPGRSAYWVAEVIRDGMNLSRPFASELHARAWLHDLLRPVRTCFSIDWEELNAPLRTACVACLSQSK